MSTLLQKVKTEALQITHLNNEEKSRHMTCNNCGWEDILNKAEDLYKEQMVDGMERWPPVCNTRDSKAPPSQFSANLTQAPAPLHHRKRDDNRDRDRNGKGNGNGNGNGNSNGYPKHTKKNKKPKDNSKNPKFQPPTPDEKPTRHVNGCPVYERNIKGRVTQWCSKCTPPRWSTTHNTGTHSGKVNPRNNPDAQANYGHGLVPDPSIWIAETFAPVDNSNFEQPRGPPLAYSYNGRTKILTKHKVKRTSSKRISKPEPLKSIPSKPSLPNGNSFNHYGLLIICFLATVLNPIIFTWISSAVIKNYDILRAMSIGEIIDMISLLPAPLLWIFLAYTVVYGNQILFTVYPKVVKEAIMPQPRNIRRVEDQSNRRVMKKHFKSNKSRSNLRTVRFNNNRNERIADLSSQVWEARRNKTRNVFERNGN